MKLSNLRDVHRDGNSALNWVFTAKVDVTSGVLWWKKTVTRQVARKYVGFWFFIDTGAWTPGNQIEQLARPIELERGW